jgi:L-asparaginase / beta-aspartyl-peptidase
MPGIAKILVHGGAGGWNGFDEDAVLAVTRAAAQAGWEVLQGSGSALDAVEAATIVLEDHPLFDAGFGSFVNEQGEVEMDALIADGTTTRFGAVAAVRRVKNAIQLARLVMTETKNCFFVSDGADQLAARLGMPLVANVSLITDKELAQFRERAGKVVERARLGTGTVGAVAIDSQGRLASATSTGGIPDKIKGRVGDSPMFGAGGYANPHAAASATGQGENMMRFFLCKEAADRVRAGLPAPEAVMAAMNYLVENIPVPDAGIILVDAWGNLAATHTTNAMPIAWVDGDGMTHASMTMRGHGWLNGRA